MKNCIAKIIDNVFEKNDEDGLFPLTLASPVAERTPPEYSRSNSKTVTRCNV